MNNYMLMFSLGPIQPFILQARKTRDLWIGSLLLSKLMEAAMYNVKGKFVFPAVRVTKDIPDIPNKYVALFASPEDAQKAAQQSKKQIKERWDDIWQTVWLEVVNKHGDQITWQIWQRQTKFDHLFEIYWAISEEKVGYGEWLDATESLFAARKRLRDFTPQDEPGEKSAVSGEREVLRNAQESSRGFWTSIANKYTTKDINQEGDERLDAIDTIKRFAMQARAISEEKPFPSTSTIATASFVEALLDCDPQIREFVRWSEVTNDKLIVKQLGAMRDIPYLAQKASGSWRWILRRDGDLYFPAIFAAPSLKKDYSLTDPNALIMKEGKATLHALLSKTNELKITRPTPYYAIIQMDGDNMGMLLSGTKSDEEHQKISQALSDFAREDAPDLVERQYPARLVYAGGDDVLAFAPLARDMSNANRGQPLDILELVSKLQSHYQSRVKGVLPLENKVRIEDVTASMGIAIAHHYTSLSYVLRSARDAEKAAKNSYGRNALVVTLLRRSGEQTRVGCHWYYPMLEDDGQPIPLFSEFLKLFKDDILSPKCVHILLEEAPALVGLHDENAQKSEIRRVLLRQLNLEQKSDEEKKTLKGRLKTLSEYIVRLAVAMNTSNEADLTDTKEKQKGYLAVELHSTGPRHGIVEVLGWLLVMAFLARKDQEQ